MTAPAWMEHAVCRYEDASLFFARPGEHESTRRGRVARAKAACGRCHVASQCLCYALTNREKEGIWGGVDFDSLSTRELLNMRCAS